MKRAHVDLAIAAFALALFCFLAVEMGRGSTAALDAAARRFVLRIASPELTFSMRIFSLLGEFWMLAGIVALGVAWFLRRGHPHAAALLVISMAGAGILDAALKALFHRLRPEPFFGTRLPDSYSFPSGHAFACTVVCGVLAGLLTAREPRRRVRIALWTAAAFVAAAIGFSRVYLGVHYASDVLAGFAAAIVWVFAMITVYRTFYARHL